MHNLDCIKKGPGSGPEKATLVIAKLTDSILESDFDKKKSTQLTLDAILIIDRPHSARNIIYRKNED